MRGCGVLLLLLAGCPSGEPEPVALADTAAEARRAPGTLVPPPDPLADEVFRFCHEAGADRHRTARWCALLDDLPEETCPGLRATCEAGDFSEPAGCQAPSGTASRKLGGEEGLEDPPMPSMTCDPPTVGGLDALWRWLAAGAVALAILLIVRLLWSRLGPRGPRVAPARPGPAPEVLPIEGDDDLPTWPEEDLLAHAERALEAGRLDEAVLYARGAALRRLARDGVLRLHRARTDREYLGRLRRHPHREGVRLILDAVETLRWAGRELTPQAAAEAVRSARRVVVVALALWVAVVPAAWGSARHGPQGDAAIHTLLSETGHRVDVAIGSLTELTGAVDAVFLDLYGVQPDEEDWAALASWVEEGGVLVVGGDATDPFPELGALQLNPSQGTRVVAAGAWRDLGAPVPVWPEGPTYVFCDARGFGWLVPEDEALADPELPCEDPAAMVLAPRGLGWVVGLADPLVLWNASMMVPANRAFLSELLGWGVEAGLWTLPRRPTVLLALVSRGGASTPPQTLFRAHMLPFVLQLLLAAAVVALWRGVPAAPLRDPPEGGRAAFSEHARAVGRHWHRLEDRRHAASAFASLWQQRLGHTGLTTAAMRDGRGAAEARAFATRIDTLAHRPADVDEADIPALVEDLWNMTRHR